MARLVCIHCKSPKRLSEMSKDSSDKRGHKGLCKECAAKKQAKIRDNWSPERHAAANAAMLLCARKRLYGLDGIEHFEKQRKLQKGKCAICKRKLNKACSDHNHETGKWRGLLCDNCNRGMGLLKDDIMTLQAAIAYLKKWETQN